MLLKQWACVVLMFVLYPITAYSQASLYRLPAAETSLGLNLSKQNLGIITPRDTTTIGANLNYGIEDDLAIFFQIGVGLTDTTTVPPAPSVELGIAQVKPLGNTDLEYFLDANFGAAFFRSLQESTNQVLERSRILKLSGAAGILKRIETADGQVITPFFALSYTRFWEAAEINAELTEELEGLVFKQTATRGDFAGEIGVEIELSPTVTALGGFKFSFERSDIAFRVGLNFY